MSAQRGNVIPSRKIIQIHGGSLWTAAACCRFPSGSPGADARRTQQAAPAPKRQQGCRSPGPCGAHGLAPGFRLASPPYRLLNCRRRYECPKRGAAKSLHRLRDLAHRLLFESLRPRTYIRIYTDSFLSFRSATSNGRAFFCGDRRRFKTGKSPVLLRAMRTKFAFTLPPAFLTIGLRW